MLIFHQGVSSTKAKKRNRTYFKVSEQNPVSVKKRVLDTFSTSSMRLQDLKRKSRLCSTIFIIYDIKLLHNVCVNQVHQFAICTICIIYYTIYHTMQYRNHVLNRKKKDIQLNILEIFHGTSICQLVLKIKYIPILRNVPAVCRMFQ